MLNEDVWLIECDQAAEDFQSGRIGEAEFRVRLAQLGFDRSEINDQLNALQE